jgi:hypothetical protein
VGINDPLRLPDKVHEHFLTGHVVLAHDHVDGAFPASVVMAELGVLKAVLRVIIAVFDPELLQSQLRVRAPKLPVQEFIVGFDPLPVEPVLPG